MPNFRNRDFKMQHDINEVSCYSTNMWHPENASTHADGRWVMQVQKFVNLIGVKGDASNTHPAFVRAGPRPAEVYSLKY